MSYTPEHEKLLAAQFDELLKSCEKIIKTPEDWDTIKRAYMIAKGAHAGAFRKTADKPPFMVHPIAVAMIVVNEIGLGVKSVAAALLHDVVEDTDYTVEDIEGMFGPKIAMMVQGLTKIDGVFEKNQSANVSNEDFSAQAESFRKVLWTLSGDARVILIKIADRLHNMRTLEGIELKKQIKTTSETILLFAPLAYKLGLYQIKTELENLCLKYRFPEGYEDITKKLAATEQTRSEFIENFIAPIRKSLQESNIDFKIEGRIKSPYSIWLKMQRKQIPFEEIYDLFAIRIVFNPSPHTSEKSQCWNIYSLITDMYNPHPDRIRDWISNPKQNGYESLHMTVMSPGGAWVEVQIRSQRMEEIAEMGFAAHWKYKRQGVNEEEPDFDKRLRELRDALKGSTEDAVEFLDNFIMTLYTSEIIVFTPKGETRKLPQGATALDYAYAVHTNIGNQAMGAKIDHKVEPIYKQLSSGDQVEILTSKSTYPKPEWLDHVITARARQAIKSYLKESTHDSMKEGMRIFGERLREFGIKPSARLFRKVLPAYNSKTKDEFYSKLGSGQIRLDHLGEVIDQNLAVKVQKFWEIALSNPFANNRRKNAKKIRSITGEKDAKNEFVIATCCNPVPGDEIIGYLNNETKKVEVHKTSCDQLTTHALQHGNRVKSVEWASYKALSHFAAVGLRGIDRIGIMMEVSKLIAGELNINIRELHIKTHDGIFEGTMSVYVQDKKDIDSIIGKVKKVKGIDEVKRIN